jgi:hypothetical protein
VGGVINNGRAHSEERLSNFSVTFCTFCGHRLQLGRAREMFRAARSGPRLSFANFETVQ